MLMNECWRIQHQAVAMETAVLAAYPPESSGADVCGGGGTGRFSEPELDLWKGGPQGALLKYVFSKDHTFFW